jgi:hypothetical protein
LKTSRIKESVVAIALLLSTIFVISPASGAITLPRGSWLPCDQAVSNYCIESISIQHSGDKAYQLRWVESGSASSGVPISDPRVVAGKVLPGRWTIESWNSKGFDSLGYDGLYVDVKPANDFVPWVYVVAQPTLTTNQQVALAAQSVNPLYPTNLDSETLIDIKLRTGNIKVGITFGVGTDVSTDIQESSLYSKVDISGYPVAVPLAKSPKDCVDNTGIAVQKIVQFQSVVVPENDSFGFGLQGLTGKLYVGSNGICKLSTPIWDPSTKTFKYSASAPRLAPNGTSVNTGFYRAVIPYSDAVLMWGLTKPQDAASALVVSITTSNGGSVAATKSVTSRNGAIIIDVSGFEFPDPILDIRLNPTYSENSAGLGALVSTPSTSPSPTQTRSPSPTQTQSVKLAPRPSLSPKKTTIKCVKGLVTKVVTALNPSCPTSYKKAKLP